MSSKYLTPTQEKGLLRVGDAVIPGNGEFPRFSKTDFFHQIDRMLDYMPKGDRDGVVLLFGIFRFLPLFVLRGILRLTDWNRFFPGPIGGALRMIALGMKGMIFTLYYSGLEDRSGAGERIMTQIHYDAHIPSYQPEKTMKVQTLEEVFSNARRARSQISGMTIAERLIVVGNLKRLILERKEAIIDVVQKDTKKSRMDALVSEIFSVLDHLDFLLKESKKTLADEKVKTPIALMGKKSKVVYDSLGTVLVISPWNYPFYQAIVPITSSFVCGNATIYKPSEFTPLTGLVEGLLKDAGFDQNWVQVVYGDGKTGSTLIDLGPDKIFFTGSVATGKKIMAQAAAKLTPVELELGGKDPMIVFEDADIQRAAAGAAWGAFTNTGQSCTSVERLYVHEAIYDRFKTELVRVTRGITQGVDSDGSADIGGMTTPSQIEVVRRHVEDAKKNGATLLTGAEWDGRSGMIPPIVLEDADRSLAAKEETFGPLLPLIRFKTEDEVVGYANDSEYGLSASVWSKDVRRAERVARRIVTGNVSINNVMATEGNHHLPFGGTRASGFGRYKGKWGLHAFSNTKAILIDGNSAKIEVNWYPYTKEKYRLFSKMTDGLYGGGLGNFFKFAMNGMKAEGLSQRLGKPNPTEK